jgi:hypothetical protein
MEGHEDGVVPGGVLNGMVAGTGGIVELGDFRTGNFVIADGLPVDYPILDTDGWGWSYAHHTNEYWTIYIYYKPKKGVTDALRHI